MVLDSGGIESATLLRMESKEDNPSFKSVSHKRLSKSSSVNQTESPKKRPSGVFMKKCAQMSLQEGNLTVKRRVQTKAEPTVKPTKTIELVAEQPHSAEADKTASGKKVKGKGRKKIKRKARKIPPPKEKDHRENALEYVKLWNSNREHWSFKKKYQIWLLKNMYDKSKVFVLHTNNLHT